MPAMTRRAGPINRITMIDNDPPNAGDCLSRGSLQEGQPNAGRSGTPQFVATLDFSTERCGKVLPAVGQAAVNRSGGVIGLHDNRCLPCTLLGWSVRRKAFAGQRCREGRFVSATL
jgi:hypothetical protein